MRVKAFRVQNFKKVDDTGWVSCDDITAFVGKNESGKSAIFRGLSKLNPSDGEKYDGLKEFPRRRFTSEFDQQDWPVSSVEFELSPSESQELEKICSVLKEIRNVICTRHYSSKLLVQFKPNPELPDISVRRFIGFLTDTQSATEKSVAPEGKGEQLVPVKKALLALLTSKIQQLTSPQDPATPMSEALVTEVNNGIMSNLNEEWQKDQFKATVQELVQIKADLHVRNQMKLAENWVVSHIPKFIYFDTYDVLESAVHFPTFLQQLQQTPSAPRVRTTRCLFEHVGISADDMQRLDPSQVNKDVQQLRRWADERAIRMSSASNAMTQKFSEWWEQRKHKFRYQADGPFFRVWVSDDLDPSEIELDQRSAGMQYFFSFYLVFLVEAEAAHVNSILLLDEPGLHVHGTAQQKITKFLEKLSEQNQLLYTTHSPFMIDGDHLERVRVVYEHEKDGSTKVSEDIWPRDEDSLFPLQAGLGYAVAQTLFYSKRQLVVEGITDYWVLKAINEILPQRGMTALRRDLVIVPAGGVTNLMPLASMLSGHEIKIAVLLDGDEPGIRKGKEVESKLMIRCLFVSNYAEKEGAELEDMFPDAFYLDAVKEAYQVTGLSFTSEENNIKPIVKRAEAALKRIGKDSFEKWRPARVILDWLQDQKRLDMIGDETLRRFERIFGEVNGVLGSEEGSAGN